MMHKFGIDELKRNTYGENIYKVEQKGLFDEYSLRYNTAHTIHVEEEVTKMVCLERYQRLAILSELKYIFY